MCDPIILQLFHNVLSLIRRQRQQGRQAYFENLYLIAGHGSTPGGSNKRAPCSSRIGPTVSNCGAGGGGGMWPTTMVPSSYLYVSSSAPHVQRRLMLVRLPTISSDTISVTPYLQDGHPISRIVFLPWQRFFQNADARQRDLFPFCKVRLAACRVSRLALSIGAA